MFDGVRKALAAWKLWGLLKEARLKGKLLTVAAGLGGAILTAVVAKFTSQCPDLFSNVGSLVTTGIMGAVAYVKTHSDLKISLLWAAAAAGVAAIINQIRLMCGADFFTVAPTLLIGSLWVGVMAWIKAPKV